MNENLFAKDYITLSEYVREAHYRDLDLEDPSNQWDLSWEIFQNKESQKNFLLVLMLHIQEPEQPGNLYIVQEGVYEVDEELIKKGNEIYVQKLLLQKLYSALRKSVSQLTSISPFGSFDLAEINLDQLLKLRLKTTEGAKKKTRSSKRAPR